MAFEAVNEVYVLAKRTEKVKMTPEEENAIHSCYYKFLGTCMVAFGVGGGLSWQVSKRFKMFNGLGRFGLAVGAASTSFSIAWDWSGSTFAVPCLDRILKQDATRVQRELVNVLERTNKGEAWRWQLMSKYFYPEPVYVDEGDKPQMRWRRRTTFTEVASSYDDVNQAKPQRTHNGLLNTRNRSILHGSDVSKSKPMLQDSSVNGKLNGGMVEENALDIVFGSSDSEPTESIPHAPVHSKVSAKSKTRKQKRAQRRQRIKNREASSNTPQYELA